MGKQSRTANQQRRIAASILKAGHSRIWMDPAAAGKISGAITRADVRRLIKNGMIRAKRKRVPTPGEGMRRQGTGSRKGAHGARLHGGPKERWLKTVRPQRKLLVEVKGTLKPAAYRTLYRLVKGGAFRSRAHLTSYMEEHKLLKK